MEQQTIPKDLALEVLLGEDFNRLNEIAPRLMRELAKRADVSIGELRQMAEEGKLTSAVLLSGATE